MKVDPKKFRTLDEAIKSNNYKELKDYNSGHKMNMPWTHCNNYKELKAYNGRVAKIKRCIIVITIKNWKTRVVVSRLIA